jgi:hypothetical protein
VSQRVSVDHYQSALGGRLYTSKGSTPAQQLHTRGVIFVDRTSGHIDIRHQVHFNAAETIEAKVVLSLVETGVRVVRLNTVMQTCCLFNLLDNCFRLLTLKFVRSRLCVLDSIGLFSIGRFLLYLGDRSLLFDDLWYLAGLTNTGNFWHVLVFLYQRLTILKGGFFPSSSLSYLLTGVGFP